MSYPLGVYSDLILSSCFKLELYLGILIFADCQMSYCLAVGRCVLPILARRPLRIVTLTQLEGMYLE